MDFARIRYFVDVVKFGSFTKAAHANYISQTAISLQIAALESELGIRLINRSKKGLTVTEAGRSFYDSCIQILSQYSRSVSIAKCVDQGLSGRITLGVSLGMNNRHIHNAIYELLEKYKDVAIMMRAGAPADLRHMLKAVGINMAVALPYDFYSLPNVTIEPLFSCGYSLAVSEKHPLAALDEVSVNEIKDEKFAVIGESVGEMTYSHIVVEHMQNIHKLKPVFNVDNFETLNMMVDTNQAVAILPECMAFPETSKSKRLRLLDYPETVTYSVIWRPGISSPGLVNFVEILKDYFGNINGLEK